MENNLEDILVDNIEEKSPSKPKLRLIVIAVASIVLLAVLGTLAYVLLKSEPKSNPEFDNTQLEKIVPQEAQTDDMDAFIQELKSKEGNAQAQNASAQKAPASQEETKPSTQEETKSLPTKEAKTLLIEPEAKPVAKETPKAQSKSSQQSAVKTKEEKKQAQKKVEKKVEKKAEKKAQKNAPSASKAFESVQTNTAPKGFYLQVGVFGQNPQSSFISKLSTLDYKTEKLQKNGKVLTRYIVGPYSSRAEAESKVFDVMQTMGIKPVVVEIK